MYRIKRYFSFFSLLIIIFYKINLFGTDADLLCKQFEHLYARISNLTSPAFSAMSLDSSEKKLIAVQKQTNGIDAILRINSVGLIINEITPNGSSVPMRNVADQQWFQQVKSKLKNYNGTTRETDSRKTFFWAWPIITVSGGFGGVLAIKIDLADMVDSFLKKDSGSVRVFYNNQILYSNTNRSESHSSKAMWSLPDSSQLTIECFKSEIDNRNISNAQEKQYPKDSMPDLELRREGSTEKLAINKSGLSKKGSGILIYLLLIVILFVAWILAKKLKKKELIVRDYKNKSKNKIPFNRAIVALNKVAPVSMIEGSNATDSSNIEECDTECDTENEMSQNKIVNRIRAEETYDKIKSFIPTDQESDFCIDASFSKEFTYSDVLREELYREIHSQITHWVIFESARLSKCLEELSERVGKLEKNNDPEISKIRNEAQRISKEIALFRDNIADGEML